MRSDPTVMIRYFQIILVFIMKPERYPGHIRSSNHKILYNQNIYVHVEPPEIHFKKFLTPKFFLQCI